MPVKLIVGDALLLQIKLDVLAIDPATVAASVWTVTMSESMDGHTPLFTTAL